MKMQSNGNLLEIIDLAHSLRQEHLFIANEQAAFNRLNETLSRNSSSVAQVNGILYYLFSYSFFSSTRNNRRQIKNGKLPILRTIHIHLILLLSI